MGKNLWESKVMTLTFVNFMQDGVFGFFLFFILYVYIILYDEFFH